MQHITWQDFACYLQQLRYVHHLSQEQMAQELSCSRNHIWRLEHTSGRPGKVLLRLIEEKYSQVPEDAVLFLAWQSMVEYRCDDWEIDDSRLVPAARGTAHIP